MMRLLKKYKIRKFKIRIKFKKVIFRVLTVVFYAAIGLAASLLLFLILYWVLLLDSNISTLIDETSGNPFYFWTYVGLTAGTIILFGANASLFIYRMRRYGLPKLRHQTGTGVGSFVALAASACPVCGSTLLSAIGIAGGISAFPFQGLELKTLSFGLMALPVFLTVRDIRKKGCVGKICPVPKKASFAEKDAIWLANIFLAITLMLFVGWNYLRYEPVIVNALYPTPADETSKYAQLQAETREKLLPKAGIKTQITAGDTIVKMVDLGIIDTEKMQKQYEGRGGIPQEMTNMLTRPSTEPLVVTAENQQWLVTILWPLGLANKLDINRDSPVAGKNLFNFASTGGWTLGREKNGGAYFNKYGLVTLTEEQEVRVRTIAEGVYRPCCNNSTFFQDCNHGSAALAIIELEVAQGQSDEEIYKNVLAFNSFWFPQNYLETALYFKEIRGQDWETVDPKMILSADYSSGSGWAKNVHTEVSKIPGLAPEGHGGSGCGV